MCNRVEVIENGSSGKNWTGPAHCQFLQDLLTSKHEKDFQGYVHSCLSTYHSLPSHSIFIKIHSVV